MINSAQSSNPTNQNFFLNTLRNFGRLFRFTNTARVSPLDSQTVKKKQTQRTQSTQYSSRRGREATHSQSWLYDSEGFSRAQTRHAIQASIRTYEAENEKRLKTAIANSILTKRAEDKVREAIKISLESPTQERTATSSTPPAEAQQKQNANERSANPQPEQQRSTGSASVETSKAPPAPKSSTASVNMQPAENKTDKNSTPSASHQTPKASTDNTASVPKPTPAPAPASVSASVSAQVEAPKFVYHSPQLLKSLKLVLRSPKSIEPEVFTFKLESGFTSLEVLLDSKQNNEPVPDLTPISRSNSASSISESPEEIDLIEVFDHAESIDKQSAPAENAPEAANATNLPLRFPAKLKEQLRNRMVDVNLDPVETELDDSMLLDGFNLNDNTHEQISTLLESFKNITEPTLANMQERWDSIAKYVAEREGSAHLWIYLTKVFSGILEYNLDKFPENATITLSNASPAANTPEEFTIPINAFIHATNLITSHSEKLWNAESLGVGDSMASPVLSKSHWTTYILKRPSENEYEVTMINSLENGQISKRLFTAEEYNNFSNDMKQKSHEDTISSRWSSEMRIGAGNAIFDTSGFTPFTQNGNTCHFYSVVNAINYFAHDFTQNTAR
jgi:hypothetical protein